MCDITEILGANRKDMHCQELVSLLWNHLGSPMEISKREILFAASATFPALKVVFTKEHTLEAILCDPELPAGDLENIRHRIESELLDQSRKKVGREIVFSSFPVTGFYKFGNGIQILPVPADAPQCTSWGNEHPFLLEFEYTASTNVFIDGFRRAQQAARNSAILSVILDGGVAQKHRRIHTHWVLAPNVADSTQSYQNLPAGYGYDGFKAVDDKFSKTEELGLLAQIPDAEYFSRGNLLNTMPLEVPDSLDRLLSKFWQLPNLGRERIFRAAHWFGQARNLWFESKSSSYLAAAMAIETMVDDDKKPEKCPSCGVPKENGPTKKFREFLEKYAPFESPSEKDRKIRTDLYELRSGLAHGVRIFLEDTDHHSVAMTSTRSTEEDQKMVLILRLTRIALVNWLTSQPELSAEPHCPGKSG